MDHHCDSKLTKENCQASRFVSAEQGLQDHFEDIPEGATNVDEELLFEYLEEIDLEAGESLRRHYRDLIRKLRKGSEAIDISELLRHKIPASLGGHMHLNGSTMQKKRCSADEKKRCNSVEKLSNKLGRFKVKTLILGEDGRKEGH